MKLPLILAAFILVPFFNSNPKLPSDSEPSVTHVAELENDATFEETIDFIQRYSEPEWVDLASPWGRVNHSQYFKITDKSKFKCNFSKYESWKIEKGIDYSTETYKVKVYSESNSYFSFSDIGEIILKRSKEVPYSGYEEAFNGYLIFLKCKSGAKCCKKGNKDYKGRYTSYDNSVIRIVASKSEETAKRILKAYEHAAKLAYKVEKF